MTRTTSARKTTPVLPAATRRMNDLVELAKTLAYRAHTFQQDKAGQPYIEHVKRVAAAVSDDPSAEIVAWLHDVWEDQPRFNDGRMPHWLPQPLAVSIGLLNRRNFDKTERYFASIRLNALALRVKLADITDNSDEARLAMLDEVTAARLRQKYATARALLGCPVQNPV